jgi:hypothetical protein
MDSSGQVTLTEMVPSYNPPALYYSGILHLTSAYLKEK